MHSKNPDIPGQRVSETGPKDLLILLEISQEGDEGLNFLLLFFGGEGLSVDVVAVQSLSHVRLCSPMDCVTPGSSVHGILQARILEWVTIPFSRGSSRPMGQTFISFIGRGILYHWATWKAQVIDWCCSAVSVVVQLLSHV